MIPFLLLVLCAAGTGVSGVSAVTPTLPAWFPMQGIKINPDQLEAEDFGTDDFDVAGPKGGQPTSVTVRGHHWSTPLYPANEDDWNGKTVWARLRPALEGQGFAVVFLRDDGSINATFRKGSGDRATWVEMFLSADDAHGNWLHIVEAAPMTRTHTLVPPGPTPEPLADQKDFPYLTPLAGSKLLGTRHDEGPLDVAGPNDREPRLIGTASIDKIYEEPPGMSDLDFATIFSAAFKAAGWTMVSDRSGQALLAHFTKNGRDVWAKIYREGGGRMDYIVVDAGSSLRAALEKDCRAPLYGLVFDFNKAVLRPESNSVLQQVLAVLKTDSSVNFELAGHTDNVGERAYNQQLSEERAAAVKTWLTAHGIAAGRLETKGYGDTMPVVPNNSDGNRARNRRVELRKAHCAA